MPADPIKIQGLKEFQQGLKRLDADLPKALRVAFNTAADIVVTEARAKVPSRTGRAKASVQSRSTQTAARVIGGSKKVPYYPWLDFGGTIRPRNTIHRPFLKDGRYIYAAYFANRDRFAAATAAALVDVARAAGLEVENG